MKRRYGSIRYPLFFSLGLHATLVGIVFFASSQLKDLKFSGGPTLQTMVVANLGPNRAKTDPSRFMNKSNESNKSDKKTQNKPVSFPQPQTPGSGGSGFGKEAGGNLSVLEIILSRIDRAKQYPLAAKTRGWEGSAQIAFEIAPDGRPRGIKLVASSGVSLLDDEALATIARASPYPSYEGQISVNLKFKLEE